MLEESQTSLQQQEALTAQEEDTDDYWLEESCFLRKSASFEGTIVPR